MRGYGWALMAMALCATSASASDKHDFETCDGRVHPGKQADGLRGAASSGPYAGLFGTPIGTIEACTRALASPLLLPTQTLRRAHLLRARAAARLQTNDPAEALKDLDAAQAAAPEIGRDPFLRRSMGVSLTLLRSLARAEAGDATGAVPDTREASALRPYSLQVQQVVATLLQAARPMGDTSPSPWLAVMRLAPDSATAALIKEAEIGNFASVLALRPMVQADWPAAPITPTAIAVRAPDAQKLIQATIVAMHVGYARAATGDPAGARRDVAEVRARLAALRSPSPAQALAADKPPVPPAAANALWEGLDHYVDVHARQIEARIAVAEKRPSEAVAALVAAPMPRDAATLDLLTALRRAMPGNDAALVPDIAPFEQAAAKERRDQLPGIVAAAMIAPETPRAVVDYARARPNILGALVGGALSMGTSLLGGIGRTDGFRSTDNPDGTVRVEFLGNTPSGALVQEMTLLRAAELARTANKPGFVIIERKDYARRFVQSQYGREVSSTPTGFKTELLIRPVAADADPQRSLDTLKVIDALGPLYYENKLTADASSKKPA